MKMIDPWWIAATEVKVTHLASQLFPYVESSAQLEVAYLGTGSYNRVIGLTVKGYTPLRYSGNVLSNLRRLFSNSKPKEYVVRIPYNYEDELAEELLYDIAILQVVAPRLSVPIPTVVDYDTTSDNVLDSPYLLQTRMRGSCLQLIWNDMNCRQRVSAIKQITAITEKISAVTSPIAGRISADNVHFPSTSHIEISQFPVPNCTVGPNDEFKKPKYGPAKAQTPLEWIVEQCERFSEYEEIVTDGGNRELWWQLICIAQCLERKGWLGDKFYLSHNDLFARNIMAVIKDVATVEITGVIDWDMATFSPRFMALRAPFHMWADDPHLYEDDENRIHEEPARRTDRAVKQAYCDAASDEYRRFAFAPEAILARRMFEVLTNGMLARKEETASIVRAWNALYPSDLIYQPIHPDESLWQICSDEVNSLRAVAV